MGLPTFDFGPFLAFVFFLGGGCGAVALALFLFLPLPWSFYAGLASGALGCMAAVGAWFWFIQRDFF